MACRQKIIFDDFLDIMLLERFYPDLDNSTMGSEAGSSELNSVKNFRWCFDTYNGSCAAANAANCRTLMFFTDGEGNSCMEGTSNGENTNCNPHHNLCNTTDNVWGNEMSDSYYRGLYDDYINSEDDMGVSDLAQKFGIIYTTDEVCSEVVETDNSKLYLGIGAVALGLGIALLYKNK